MFRDETSRVIDRVRSRKSRSKYSHGHLTKHHVRSFDEKTYRAIASGGCTLSSNGCPVDDILDSQDLTLGEILLRNPDSSRPSDSRRSPLTRATHDRAMTRLLMNPAAPSEQMHDLGINYFLINFVVQDSGPCPGFLNYASAVLSDPSDDRELAQVAVRAVGLAGLSNTTGAQSVMNKARTSYSDAIKRVNVALSDLETARKNSTVFAAMILSLFATVTCADDESLQAWKHHIDGVSNLLLLRGASQLRTQLGREMFSEALSHILTLCSRYGRPVLPGLRLLRVEMAREDPIKPRSIRLALLHAEVMNIYSLVDPDRKTAFLYEQWQALFSNAADLDQRLEQSVMDLPSHWRYAVVKAPLADNRVVYGGIYHVYYNSWVAKIHNGLRSSRILLNEAIQSLLLREGLTWAPQGFAHNEGDYQLWLQRASRTTLQLRDEILASVPLMLGFVQCDDVTGNASLVCGNSDIPRNTPASGAYFALWHLYLAGGLEVNSSDTRAWVCQRLRAIRSATGIQKAGYLADKLESN